MTRKKSHRQYDRDEVDDDRTTDSPSSFHKFVIGERKMVEKIAFVEKSKIIEMCVGNKAIFGLHKNPSNGNTRTIYIYIKFGN